VVLSTLHVAFQRVLQLILLRKLLMGVPEPWKT
jgi:hypothetical protein